ncbi:MAG: hypothetical protein KF805_05740 [Phycisphaeraceae bacterium]|nr:hypothetical protein [Phycisphaeraceae bacterium]
MPAWPKLKLPLLADLAEQLRYAPKAAVVKDIVRTVETIGLIDPATDYPADWIAFRITGYRADQPFEPLSGARLAPQLARLVELLSAQSRLTEADLKALGPGLDQPTLLKRWNISRKTLERYRSKGLVAVRLLSDRGRSRLFFPRSTTESFETVHAGLLEKARVFTRLDESARDSIRTRADKLRRKATASRSRIAAHLSRRTGRSRSAIERALPPRKRAERRPRQSGKARLALLSKWESGAGAGELARQSGKTRPAIVHALSVARRDRLEAWDASTRFPPDLTQEVPGSLEEIAGMYPRASAAPAPRPEPDLEVLLEAMRRRAVPDRASEREFALAHHACMRLAGAARSLSAENLDLAETALRWGARIRAILIGPHRAVIVESIESLVAPGGVELLRADPALLAGALLRGVHGAALAIEGFTPETSTRREIGGSLAGPISLAVGRTLSEWTKSNEREIRMLRTRQGMRAARALGAIPDWAEYASPWLASLSPARVRTRRQQVALAPEHEKVLGLRFGWDSRPHTVAEIARFLGVTRIRAAAILQAALRAVPA